MIAAKKTPEAVWWIISTVGGLLLAGNIFFVKRLVDQIDATTQVVWQLRQDVVVLQAVFEEHKKRTPGCRNLKGE